MATEPTTGSATGRVREGVRAAYTAAASDPRAEHPFPVGRRFAESLGYPEEILARVPEDSVAAFAGVSNVAVTADLPPGATVLDLGCGAGLDALVTSRRVGPAGRVLGLDFSEAMLRRAHRAIGQTGVTNVTVLLADAERLPLRSSSVDVALINGVFNLNPARAAILSELARVVRTGGAVFAAELVLEEPGPASEPEPGASWFA